MINLDLRIFRRDLEEYGKKVYGHTTPMPAFSARYEHYIRPDQYTDCSDWFSMQEGDGWDCGMRTTLRLKNRVHAPAVAAGERLVMLLQVGGEALVKVNGKPVSALSGAPDGSGVRDRVELPSQLAGQELELEIEVCALFMVCNAWFSKDDTAIVPSKLHCARFAVVNEEERQFYYDMKVISDALDRLTDQRIRTRILEAGMLALLHAENAGLARQRLQEALNKLPASVGKVIYLGQAHIDTAWLWTIPESIRKTIKTFENALDLMERYPDYVFSFSQPALYELVERYDPELFARIQKRVQEGRIELVGNAWVEMDTNMPSGESLVRQLLYGRAYYRSRFGRDSKIFWMPDVFGYSWALPQIMKKSGVDYFFTSKLINNDTNAFPHSLFVWQGMDGTKVPAYLQRMNYNGMLDARTTWDMDEKFDQKALSDACLMTFGFGDGGGGPTAEMLENASRLACFPGMPQAKLGTALSFFQGIEDVIPDLPRWNDEMYYECHRGTYTSQAHVKRCNRKMEQLLRRIEAAFATCKVYLGTECPTEEIGRLWKDMLILQFHDILPGSSIHAVYEEYRQTYQALFERGQALLLQGMELLSTLAGEGEDTWNFTPWTWEGIAPYACGTPCLAPGKTQVRTDLIENDLLRIELDENGLITRIFDKENRREVLEAGEKGNLLTLFTDKPAIESAWNIDLPYQNQYTDLIRAESVEVLTREDGQNVLRLVRRIGKSTVTQDLVLPMGSRRLDFVTHVDWQERDRMLKVCFPVEVMAQQAAYEIQFGAINRPTHRNTSYDKAKFEVCGHRWADLSECGYGVSLLNDCKYGYDILDNRMRLTLLRAPTYPDPKGDLGEHDFTYSLYPHAGDWRNGTVEQAYQLNTPKEQIAGTGKGFPGAVMTVESPHVALDTLKPAEDGRGIVARLYECHGARGTVHVRFGKAPLKVLVCNLMEDDEQEVAFTQEGFAFFVKPFEICTFRLIYA